MSGERLEHARGLPDLVLHPLGRIERKQDATREPRHRRLERGVVRDLDVAGAVAHVLRHVAKALEQDRLPDAAQPGDEHALHGAPRGQPLEEDVEGRDLGVAARQAGGRDPAPGA